MQVFATLRAFAVSSAFRRLGRSWALTPASPPLKLPALVAAAAVALRLHALPLLKITALLILACSSFCYSGRFLESAAELWTARFGTDADKTDLARHYQQQVAEQHGLHYYTSTELRQRFLARGIPNTLLSDSVIAR
jgi:hypothetical protein